jgi:hypothetical protein
MEEIEMRSFAAKAVGAAPVNCAVEPYSGRGAPR